MNAIVASVAIPRLSLLARQTYDPYSARQTAAALRIVDEISYSVETNSPKFEVRRPLPLSVSLQGEIWFLTGSSVCRV